MGSVCLNFIMVYCVRNTFARRCVFFCAFQTFKWKWIMLTIKSSTETLRPPALLYWHSFAFSGLVHHVWKDVLFAELFLKVMESLSIRFVLLFKVAKTWKWMVDQSLNACPATYVVVALWNQTPLPFPPTHIHTSTKCSCNILFGFS